MRGQAGASSRLLLLDPLNSAWLYGVGGLTPEQQVEGSLFFGDGLDAGEFSVRFQGPDVTGTVTLYEVEFGFVGSKAF